MKEVLSIAAMVLSISTTVALADTAQLCADRYEQLQYVGQAGEAFPDIDYVIGVMCADVVVETLRPYAREDAQRGDLPQSARFRLTDTKIISNDDGTTPQVLLIYASTED
jgi:hypothetical protein